MKPRKVKWHPFRIAQDRNGNIAITFALTLTLIMLGVGISVDYSKSFGEKEKMQEALDATVLALAARGGVIDQTYARNLFYANFTKEGGQGNWTAVNRLNFIIDTDGHYTGTVSGNVKTSLLGIAGVENVGISAYSAATAPSETKIAQATFSIDKAKGAFDKDIYFYTRDKDGKIIDEKLILKYDYTLKHGVGSSTVTPSVSESTTIDVGAYASYGYKMVVYEDTSYYGKHIKPKEYYSDDANAPSFTKVSGDCTDTNGNKNYWEDGGDADYLDFIFRVKCTEEVTSSGNVRLTQ